MSDEPAQTPPGGENVGENARESMRVHFVKSNLFRVIQASGFMHRPSPDGASLSVIAFNDRYPIPIELDYEVENDDVPGRIKLVNPSVVSTKQGIIREVEVQLLLSKDVAKKLGAAITKWADEANEGDIGGDIHD